jgi:hypothetical protein
MLDTHQPNDYKKELQNICVRYTVEASDYRISSCKHCARYDRYSVVDIKNHHQRRACNTYIIL